MSTTISTSLTRRTSLGDRWEYQGVFTLPTSWTAAGVSVTATAMGCDLRLDEVRIENKSGYLPTYDLTNNKVLIYRQKDPANAGGADIPLPAVADSTDLSTTPGTLKFWARGKGTVAA